MPEGHLAMSQPAALAGAEVEAAPAEEGDDGYEDPLANADGADGEDLELGDKGGGAGDLDKDKAALERFQSALGERIAEVDPWSCLRSGRQGRRTGGSL